MKRSILDYVKIGSKVIFKTSKFTVNSNNEKIVFTVDSIDQKHNAIDVYIPIDVTYPSYSRINSFVFNLSDIEAIVLEPSDSNYNLNDGDRLKLKSDHNVTNSLKNKEVECFKCLADTQTMIATLTAVYEINRDIIAYKIIHKHDDIFPSKGDYVLLSKNLKYTKLVYGLSDNMIINKGKAILVSNIRKHEESFYGTDESYSYYGGYTYHNRDIVKILSESSTKEHLISYY